jgi:hypothetical protein
MSSYLLLNLQLSSRQQNGSKINRKLTKQVNTCVVTSIQYSLAPLGLFQMNEANRGGVQQRIPRRWCATRRASSPNPAKPTGTSACTAHPCRCPSSRRRSSSEHRREWRIRPHARKSVDSIKKATVTELPGPAAAPPCTVTYTVPAVLFTIGGHSGRNYWHDFAHVLVPLFVASRRFDGDVQFLVANVVQPWWLSKYETLLRRLSRYGAVDLDSDEHVRCFPHVTVGIRIDKEFSIAPELSPGDPRLSMVDYARPTSSHVAQQRSSAG